MWILCISAPLYNIQFCTLCCGFYSMCFSHIVIWGRNNCCFLKNCHKSCRARANINQIGWRCNVCTCHATAVISQQHTFSMFVRLLSCWKDYKFSFHFTLRSSAEITHCACKKIKNTVMTVFFSDAKYRCRIPSVSL